MIDDQDDGHGHVWPRADGLQMRCGGPGHCPLCTADAAQQQVSRDAVELRRAERAALGVARQPHRVKIKLHVPRRPAGWRGLAWQAVCSCGWTCDPVAHHLGMASRTIEGQLRELGSIHAATADEPETIEQAVARWSQATS